MSHLKRSSKTRQLFLRLATIAFITLVVIPHARAQVLARTVPKRDVMPFVLQPLPRCVSAKPDVKLYRISEQPLHPLRMSATQRRTWLLLGLAQHGAAFFDARTTRDAISYHPELDPLLRPFAQSAALYPAMQIGPIGFDWLATRLATSHHRWLRRIWWVPQAAATVGFLWSGVHNLGLPAPSGVPVQ